MKEFFFVMGREAWKAGVFLAWCFVSITGAGIVTHVVRNIFMYGWHLIP